LQWIGKLSYMFGNNPKREAINGDGQSLFVKSTFKTLQGEGPNIGTPSVFIRLGGCNLACSFCDTEFEDFHAVSLNEIIKQTKELSLNSLNVRTINLVVITGGEPMRQPIEHLCTELIKLGYKVQIETNGTLFRPLPDEVEIICSPKVVNGKYYSIRPDLLKRITAFKFLISSSLAEYSIVPQLGQQQHSTPVYIQPMDQYDPELNNSNLKLTIQLALEGNYKFSLQMHKIIGVE
jgi:7-carboxy-7-deazaguanine synthase